MSTDRGHSRSQLGKRSSFMVLSRGISSQLFKISIVCCWTRLLLVEMLTGPLHVLSNFDVMTRRQERHLLIRTDVVKSACPSVRICKASQRAPYSKDNSIP